MPEDEPTVEQRVSALEAQLPATDRVARAALDGVADVRSEADAARILAAGADADTADFRAELRDFRQATTGSFTAVRADVRDFRAELRDFRRATTGSFTALRADVRDLRAEMHARFEQVDARFEQVNEGFEQVNRSLRVQAAGQQQIVDLLTTLIDPSGPERGADGPDGSSGPDAQT